MTGAHPVHLFLRGVLDLRLRSARTRNQRGDFVLFGNTLGYDCGPDIPRPISGSVAPECGQGTADTAMDVYFRAEDKGASASLADTDAAVIMKVGRNLPKIRRALDAAGVPDVDWSTAPEIIDLPATPLRKLITAAPGVPDTQKCSMAGPAPCPIDLFSALGGPPAARHEQLELVLDMHTNVSHSRSPTINSWQITYACPPDE